MNRQQFLLTLLAEEGAELTQRATKAMRFGLGEVQPGQPYTNEERLQQELVDIIAVVELLVHETPILTANPVYIAPAIKAKKLKIAKYEEYSRSLGLID